MVEASVAWRKDTCTQEVLRTRRSKCKARINKAINDRYCAMSLKARNTFAEPCTDYLMGQRTEDEIWTTLLNAIPRAS